MTNNNDQKRVSHYGSDFLTGCLTLILICVAIFILAPILVFILRISFVIVMPIVALLLLIIFTIFIGRIVNYIRRKQGESDNNYDSNDS